MLQTWSEIKLWKRVMGALVVGVAVGFLLGPLADTATGAAVIETFNIIGQIFVRLIKMLVVPLIFTTLVAGILAMGEVRQLGSIGVKAFGLFLMTTLFAITIGLTMGTLFQPGLGVDFSDADPRVLGEPQTLAQTILSIVPDNPVAAMAQGQVLPIIVFSILFGVGIMAAGERAKPVGDVINGAAEVMLRIAHIIMELAPIGVFALIAWVTATKGIGTLTSLLYLTLALYAGCLVHILLVHGGMITFLARLPVVTFFRGIVDPQLVAYSTSSSAATLPVSITAARDNLGVKPPVASSVLPLGATVNMDGTALYVGIVALFAVQAIGIELSMGDYFIIALMTTLVSIGTAAVPSASLFLIAGVLGNIGVSAEQTALVVGLILPFDRILDMMRTATNVTGDLAVATTVARWEEEFDEETFRARNLQ